MLDIRFLRENPDIVKENIRKKFQDRKLPLVDEVIELDQQNREAKQEADSLRANRNKLSKEIGGLYKQGKKEEAEKAKAEVKRGGTGSPYPRDHAHHSEHHRSQRPHRQG